MTRICTGDVCVRSTMSAVDEERVLHVARGMVGGNVERLEVVVLVLDVRALRTTEKPRLTKIVDGFVERRA